MGCWLHSHNHHQHHHFSLHSSAESAGDKSCENNASAPNQQQHLAGLFSGDWRLNWSPLPLFILWRIFLLFGLSNSDTVEHFCFKSLTVILTASFFHLILVTSERLIAIKFTMQYSNIVTYKNMKIAVLLVWILAFINGILRITFLIVARFFTGLITISCTLFLAFTYFIIYRETRRHQKMIIAQQLPQDVVERFVKENKALRTTVVIVGAAVFVLLPVCFCLIVTATGLYEICPIDTRWRLTYSMLNSLLNPLIYCWRQKEMREVIFGLRTRIMPVDIQWRRKM